jgi:2-keto-4-pentenoate hydratase/2-oxohepta-3-ene-1,7-dioic acid hydratase in catechol pathway
MRLARYDDDRLGLLTEDGTKVIDLTDRLGLESADPLIEYARGTFDARPYVEADPDHEVDEVRLESPVRRPGKVIAAPLNYEDHVAEMEGFEMDIKEAGYFLKAPSSIVGPEGPVVLPFRDRRCDYELELAFVMGDDVKDVTSEDAWDAILGYTILLDITVRGDQDRSNRKSYDSFTVVGPVLTTPEEVGDPHDLGMELRLNGETRQRANTGEMIYDCADLIQYASIGTTLETGDVVSTGTPSGVGELSDDDTIDAEIESIGSMTVPVEERDVSFADVDVSKGE